MLQLPLWLEMANMSRSAIAPNPRRLILKMGDDLRQDMITLRILTLFDKVRYMLGREEIAARNWL